MNIKIVIKVLIIFLMVLNVLNNSVVVAGNPQIWDTGKEFIGLGINEAEKTTVLPADTIQNGTVNLPSAAKLGIQELIDFLWGLGLLTVFLCTIILGIKYMLVPPAEKSKIKQATTPYIVGVTIIFGAVTIWKLLIEILDGNL